MAQLDVTLVSSRTDTTNATRARGSEVTGVDVYRKGTFILTVTVNSGSPTLDVAIQGYINGTWTDLARFAQVTATATRVLWDVGGTVNTSTTIEEATQDLAITVGTKRAGPWGSRLRATWTTTALGSITWSLVGSIHS